MNLVNAVSRAALTLAWTLGGTTPRRPLVSSVHSIGTAIILTQSITIANFPSFVLPQCELFVNLTHTYISMPGGGGTNRDELDELLRLIMMPVNRL